MTLTDRQVAVLNHVVIDAQSWADSATEKQMLDKVARWSSNYDAAVSAGNYKTRAERDTAAEQEEQAIMDNRPYIVKRADEYPDFRDYLDAIVKGDDAQKQKYIDDCLAVKAKYPKN